VAITYHRASDAVVMFASGALLLQGQHRQAAELQDEDAHQEEREQRAPGTVLDQGAPDATSTPYGAQHRMHPDEPEDAQHLDLREGQAGEQVGQPNPGRSTGTSTRPGAAGPGSRPGTRR
jgi:hypothetical protein